MLLQHLWILLATFTGPFIGMLIGYMAREELEDGKKYFRITEFFIILFLVLGFFFYFPHGTVSFLIFLVFLTISANKKYQQDSLIYGLFGILYFLSIIDIKLFMLTSSLIFLYGLPSGSLFLEKHLREKNIFKLIKRMFYSYGWYLFIALLFLII